MGKKIISDQSEMTCPSGFAIYLSTCDSYSDCWIPFISLFTTYWPNYQGVVYLSSEYKDTGELSSRVKPMKICSSRNISPTKRIPWSLFTRWALEAIPHDIILFLQEDFFLRGPVDEIAIENFVKLMTEHPEIECIHLTDQCGKGSIPSPFPHLDQMLTKRPYRISCQAALWRKEELLSILRDKENAWEFEIFGSSRSGALGSLYLCVSSDYVQLGGHEIIPYIFTGIIKGKWNREVPALFEAHGITMDFSKRGFFNPKDYSRGVNNRFNLDRFLKRIINRMDIIFSILIPRWWSRFIKLFSRTQK